MAVTTQLEGLIRLGANGRELADACGCEGACACADQTIELIGHVSELPASASPKARALDLKNISGLSCC